MFDFVNSFYTYTGKSFLYHIYMFCITFLLIGSSFISIILLTKQLLQVLMKSLRLNFL